VSEPKANEPAGGAGGQSGAGDQPGGADAPSGGEPLGEMTFRDLFLGLVQSFQMAAMQQLGMVPNPANDQIERDLPHAKLSIDMLRMLKERTAGNLTMEEGRYLDHVLTELQLHYVTESSKPQGAG
jgi:uncharacterized protein DUF1844